MTYRFARVWAWSLVMASLVLGACAPVEPASLAEIAARALSYTDTPEKAAVADGINGFALAMYAQLAAAHDGNIFFSPFSISTALAMTYAGACGNTATQMADSLRFGLAQEALPAAYGALLADVDAVGARDGYELSVANSLFGQQDFVFLQAFLDVLEDSYDAPLEPVDFANAADLARIRINDWVAEKTRDRIQDLLAPGAVDQATRLVLANALYFKGTWARTFRERDTEDGAFRLRDGTTVTVPMMHQGAELNHMENDVVAMLELPYTTGDLSMLFVLPQHGLTLDVVEAAITADNLAGWASQLRPVSELEVAIPRFTFASGFGLAEQLQAMGMTDAFTSAADFSGMTAEPGLRIADVHHKAFVLVNEEGTEAAAATAVVVGLTAAGPGFVADRPFLFLIRHNLSGTILFLGRVMDPTDLGV